MQIEDAILGFLDWQPLSGYELKKLFADSATHYWSGNNNQIYRALVDLHRRGLVSQELDAAGSGPVSKRYAITRAGRQALLAAVQAEPALPQLRQPFLVQLAWSGMLSDRALEELLDQYAEALRTALRMQREQEARRAKPGRTGREATIWEAIGANWIQFYAQQLAWLDDLRRRLREVPA